MHRVDLAVDVLAGVNVDAGDVAGSPEVWTHAAQRIQLDRSHGAVVLHTDLVILHGVPAAVGSEPIVVP